MYEIVDETLLIHWLNKNILGSLTDWFHASFRITDWLLNWITQSFNHWLIDSLTHGRCVSEWLVHWSSDLLILVRCFNTLFCGFFGSPARYFIHFVEESLIQWPIDSLLHWFNSLGHLFIGFSYLAWFIQSVVHILFISCRWPLHHHLHIRGCTVWLQLLIASALQKSTIGYRPLISYGQFPFSRLSRWCVPSIICSISSVEAAQIWDAFEYIAELPGTSRAF